MKSIILTLLITLSFSANANKTETAIFAGGCFWCMEHPFDELDGVISTTSGYTGGHVKNPTYHQVSAGSTGHTESMQVVYDPEKVSYETLLSVYWKNIDPTSANGQFCDRGNQYRPEIFYGNDKQKVAAQISKERLMKNKSFEAPIVVKITKASTFYPAESYHQNYYLTNPIRYKFYRYSCGRDNRLEELWGKS